MEGQTPPMSWSDLKPNDAVPMWEHFANVGGHDKDRMVTMSTWILGLSGGVLAYSVTTTVPSGNWPNLVLFGLLGLLLSALAMYVTLMYGGYANRNWATADAIAKAQRWEWLLPKNDRLVGPGDDANLVLRRAWCLAEPCDPLSRLAPVFLMFYRLGIVSAAIHAILLGVAVVRTMI